MKRIRRGATGDPIFPGLSPEVDTEIKTFRFEAQ